MITLRTVTTKVITITNNRCDDEMMYQKEQQQEHSFEKNGR